MLAERLSVSVRPFFALPRSQHASVEQEPDATLYRPALETLRTLIRTSTSSMTSVPKPLKFLRPHYYELETIYNKWPASDDKVSFHPRYSL